MRVISGIMKGKKLFSQKGDNTRPTLDRVKESIFNIIQFEIDDKTVLDLFSGSGQMAIEAISRGAKRALLFDIDREAYKIIDKNIKSTGFEDRITAVCTDYKKVLQYKSNFAPFDIVFLDPPYKTGFIKESIEFLSDNNLLSQNCVIIAESSKGEQLPEAFGDLKISKVYNYGNTSVTIYRN